MKRQFVLLALLALVLSGCSSAGAAPVMYIQPAELSAEEEAVAKLLGADTDQHLFDVVLDGTAKKVSVNTYELAEGKWELLTGGGGMALKEDAKEGRMTTPGAAWPSASRTCGASTGRPSSSAEIGRR